MKDWKDMTWQEKIAEGMRSIAEGCDENKSFADCKSNMCPFIDYCNAIEIGAETGLKIDIPETWDW